MIEDEKEKGKKKEKEDRRKKIGLLVLLIVFAHFAFGLIWLIGFLLSPRRVAACRELPRGTTLKQFEKKFGSPLYERKIDKYKWVYFKSDPFKTTPINARVNIRTGQVVELKCAGDGSSEWILDSP